MSVRAQAAQDNRAIISRDGVSVTLTPPPTGTPPVASDAQVVTGLVFRIEDQADPMTGERIHAPKTSVHVNAAQITGTITDDWTVSTTDVDGTAVSGRVVSPRKDYTLGLVTMLVEVAE